MSKFEFEGRVIKVDHFITGSGAAGALIANNLTACGKDQQSALVVEAGSANIHDKILNRMEFNRIILSNLWNKYGWPGQSYNEPYAGNRNFFVPQTGLTLGGSTRINNGNAVKASVANLQQWEELLGKFWSPERFYEAYKKLEHFHKAAGVGPTPDRGHHGPISVLQAPQSGPLPLDLDVFQAAREALGLPTIADYNNEKTPIGASLAQIFEEPNGIRSDALKAFLGKDVIEPYKDFPETFRGVGERRKHLLVFARSRFQKIIWEGNKAVGAIFIREGISYEVRARVAVWIENGFLSPQALMVSGIGPRHVLEKAGIPVVYDNPHVGRHLTNHSVVPFSLPKNPLKVGTDPKNPGVTNTVVTWFPDPTGLVNQAQRGLQIHYQDALFPVPMVPDAPLFNITPNPAILSGTMFQLYPWSKGYLKVDSTDIQKSPLVDYDYLEDTRDLNFWIQTFKKIVAPLVRQLNANDPSYNISQLVPSLAVIENPDPTALIAYIRNNVRQTHHGCGTTRMAPRDKGGVVDKRGRVHGVEHVMSFDTSTLAFQPDGNNCFTVWAGALLISDWARKRGNVDRKCKP